MFSYDRMSNNKRTPHKNTPPYRPSFVTPPPTNLYGASSQSSQGTEVLSQATEVLSDEDLPTPPLSQYNEAGAASAESATPSGPRLKKTANSGCRVPEGRFTRNGLYWRRNIKNGKIIDTPCDECGKNVEENDPSRIARRAIENVSTHVANLSSATPVSRRNVTTRAAASTAAEAAESEASSLFSPAVASAASRAPVLSLTPAKRQRTANQSRRNGNNGRNGNNERNGSNGNNERNGNESSGGARKRRTYRKKRTLRKQRTHRSRRSPY